VTASTNTTALRARGRTWSSKRPRIIGRQATESSTKSGDTRASRRSYAAVKEHHRNEQNGENEIQNDIDGESVKLTDVLQLPHPCNRVSHPAAPRKITQRDVQEMSNSRAPSATSIRLDVCAIRCVFSTVRIASKTS